MAWLDALQDQRALVRIAARLRQAEAGNLGDDAAIAEYMTAVLEANDPGLLLLALGVTCRIPDDHKDALQTNADAKHASLSWPSSGFCS